ncbi:MAG: PilN domain-containing protein [Candidatus Latescibacterota bacterium]|nr:MAG: PilN domain-containing protein [Candidatus Latescibacterota bacterium]
MIRINLLPMEDRKRSRRLRLPSFSGGGPKTIWALVAVVVYVGMVAAMASLQAKKTKDLKAKIAEAEEESAKLAPQLERIRELTKEREEVDRRLGIIASLDRDRYFRVQVMNDIAEKLPPNSWLTSFNESGGTQVSIDGVTFSNYLIADLMNNLEKSDRFSNVTLNIAQEGHIKDHKVIQFTLNSRITRQVGASETEKGLP